MCDSSHLDIFAQLYLWIYILLTLPDSFLGPSPVPRDLLSLGVLLAAQEARKYVLHMLEPLFLSPGMTCPVLGLECPFKNQTTNLTKNSETSLRSTLAVANGKSSSFFIAYYSIV